MSVTKKSLSDKAPAARTAKAKSEKTKAATPAPSKMNTAFPPKPFNL